MHTCMYMHAHTHIYASLCHHFSLNRCISMKKREVSVRILDYKVLIQMPVSTSLLCPPASRYFMSL